MLAHAKSDANEKRWPFSNVATTLFGTIELNPLRETVEQEKSHERATQLRRSTQKEKARANFTITQVFCYLQSFCRQPLLELMAFL